MPVVGLVDPTTNPNNPSSSRPGEEDQVLEAEVSTNASATILVGAGSAAAAVFTSK